MYLMRRCVAALACLAVAAVALPGAAQEPAKKDLDGIWEGTLKVGVIELRLVVNVAKKDGKWAATLDSPDQGAKGIPVDTVEFKDGKLKLELKKLRASFEGKANKDFSAIDGEWKQGPKPLPLTLKRVARAAELRRPQHPKKPFPYRAEEVTFENRKAGLKFAGTLTLPAGKGPFPAAVLISGSGPQDRDETIFGHKPFLVLADHLTRNGTAVLRVDDRGVGGSTGSIVQATTPDFAADVLAAVAYLKGRKEINARRIGLIGHSEGGIAAPLAASQSSDVAFVVLLAGTALPGEEILYLQGQAVLKAAGVSGKPLEDQKAVQKLILQAVKEEKDNEKAKKLIAERLEKKLAELSKDKKEQEAMKAAVAAQSKMLLTPWFRHFIVYDPRPALQKVRVPVLALCGEKDVQVLPKENLGAIRAALQAGGNRDHVVKELPGLNHLFQTCKTGGVSEYGRIEETFAPAALKLISDWIAEKTKERKE